jgi:hypothetical protein
VFGAGLLPDLRPADRDDESLRQRGIEPKPAIAFLHEQVRQQTWRLVVTLTIWARRPVPLPTAPSWCVPSCVAPGLLESFAGHIVQ